MVDAESEWRVQYEVIAFFEYVFDVWNSGLNSYEFSDLQTDRNFKRVSKRILASYKS